MMRLEIEGPVARVTLEHPPVNAIGAAWLRRFGALLDELAGRDDWCVLHLRSALKVFCAGADLAEMRERFSADGGIEAMVESAAAMQRLFARIGGLPQVTLVEIGGAAMGGGLELALACDVRIAAAEAKLGLPEARLGLLPGAGGTQRLTRLCGEGTAKRLILGGEVIDGAEAAQLGIVQWSRPREQLAGWTDEVVTRFAAIPKVALAANKRCIAAVGDPARDGFAEELAGTRRLYEHPETRRRVSDFFKRSKTQNQLTEKL